jgi:membrane protein involved in D-alanine export
MENILPFSGIHFFIIIFGYIAFLYVFKNILKLLISYKTLLFISIITYILVCMPGFSKVKLS